MSRKKIKQMGAVALLVILMFIMGCFFIKDDKVKTLEKNDYGVFLNADASSLERFKKYDLITLRCEAGNMYDERCLKIIGANIKLLRTCRGISQGELARALVISQTHLSNIECCRVVVNFRVLLRAANALECTLDDLLQLEFTEPPRIVMEVREYSSAEVKGFLQKLQAGKKT